MAQRRSIFADKLGEFGDFAFGDEAVRRHRGKWREFFRNRNTTLIPDSSSLPLILELGCFDAGFLTHIACKHPAANFIGLDWKARQLYLGAEQIAAQKLTHIALLRARAQELPTMFADDELDEIWLFQPEPCDRENERINRLMSEAFLLDVLRVLRIGGSLILKTDHTDYFRSTFDLVRSASLSSRFSIRIESRDYWNDPDTLKATASKYFAGESTFYEKRFIRKKQPIHFLEIARIS